MEKIALALFFVATVHTTVPFAQTVADDPKMIESWYAKLRQVKPKLTRLRLYSHDNLFGLVGVFDNPLTEEPQPSSRPVGQAQGFYASARLESLGLVMNMNFVFTNKIYNGSTLSILGRNAAMEAYCDMPIVGGSGIFRLTHGVAMATTHSFNATTCDVVVEYNIIATHY